MKLKQNLFEISKEEETMSKTLYNKVIKCLVAPYHVASQLEMDWQPNIFMFPEKEISQAQTKQFVSLLVNNPNIKEAMIITSEINIILDMYDGCVRILTEDEEIIPSPEKTFCANPHTIKYCLLENEAHQISKKQKKESTEKVNEVIRKINTKKMTQEEYDECITYIKMIGEPILANKLKEMIRNVKIIK